MQKSNLISVVVCNVCGLMYPSDYYTEWGRKYGRGLGRTPVCEGLQSDYGRPVPGTARNALQAHHPIHICRGGLSRRDVLQEEYELHRAILEQDDPGRARRMEIIRIKQNKSPEVKSILAKII